MAEPIPFPTLPMVPAAPIRGASLHDNVAERLRAMVFERQLAPGEFIDEKALAAQWQISRTPLREALKVLAAEGLVELVSGRGSRVVTLTDDDADALFPVMALLEGRCAHEATLRASDEQLAELHQLHERLEMHAAVNDIDGYYRANHAFHSQVQALAANRWLTCGASCACCAAASSTCRGASTPRSTNTGC
jgi:DNA-binding GntR family transcriptional regulator